MEVPCFFSCPIGAPYIARQEGEFAAGTAACDLKSHPAPTVIIESPLTVVTTSSDMAEHPDNQLGLESQGQDLFGAGTPVPSPEAPPPLPPPDEITPPPPPAPAMDSRELESNKPSPEPIKPAPTVLQPWNAKHPHYWKCFGCTCRICNVNVLQLLAQDVPVLSADQTRWIPQVHEGGS